MQHLLRQKRLIKRIVCFQFAELERASYQTGGAGGTPFKEQQPSELEELALAYLGIGKLYMVIVKIIMYSVIDFYH